MEKVVILLNLFMSLLSLSAVFPDNQPGPPGVKGQRGQLGEKGAKGSRGKESCN